MRCLLRYILTLIEVLYFLNLMSVTLAYGHVGEKCPFVILFRMCMATNAQCDSNNICQCKSDYPVMVDFHTCKKARRYGERCSVNAECVHTDKNSYCTQLSYRSVCECHEGFRYDSATDRCIKAEKEKSGGPSLVLPMAVGLSLVLACFICCCLASVHLCRALKRRRNRRSATPRVISGSGHRINSEESIRWTQRLHSMPSAPEDMGTLPPYDVVVSLQPIKDQDMPDMTDEYPPSYDEVMKNSG